jgi:hypothetical protein
MPALVLFTKREERKNNRKKFPKGVTACQNGIKVTERRSSLNMGPPFQLIRLPTG